MNRVSSPRRLARAVFSLAFCLVVGLTAAGAAMAETVKFSTTGEEQTFRVPAGVTSLHVVATGGQGGAGAGNSRIPGFGATVVGDLQVTPLQLLYVEVGGNGGSATGAAGAGGGFNGGGAGGSSGDSGTTNTGKGAGGGGGASDLRLIPRSVGNSLESRLITASGGGGVGGGSEGGSGGSAAGSGIGEGGTTGGGLGGGTGGTGASTTAPGPGGSLGVGGAGGSGAPAVGTGGGGGAGGGVFGGGGGITGSGGGSSGGGGAAGSSAVGSSVKGVSIVKDATGVPSITITYTVPPTSGTGGGGGTGGNGTGGGNTVLDTTIDAHPAKLIETRKEKVKVRFRFSANQPGARFLCKLDSAAFAPCTAPKRYRVFRGFHTFKVKAVGDTTPAVFSFRVKAKS